MAVGLVLFLHWWYGTSNNRLVSGEVDPRLVAAVNRRILLAPLVYVFAILESFFGTRM